MNFIKNVPEDESIVLYFYTDWCGYCSQTKPNWDLAMKRTNSKIKWLSFDCSIRSNYPFVKTKYNIKAYPQVIGLSPKNKMGKRKMLVMNDEYTVTNLSLFATTLDKSKHKRKENVKEKLNVLS